MGHRPGLHHDGKARPQIQRVEWSDTGTIDVGLGRCTLQTGPDSRTLRVEATDQDALQRIQRSEPSWGEAVKRLPPHLSLPSVHS